MTTFHDRRDGEHVSMGPGSDFSTDYVNAMNETDRGPEFFSSTKCDGCGSYGMVVGVGGKDLCPDCANETRESRVTADEKADRKTLGYDD